MTSSVQAIATLLGGIIEGGSGDAPIHGVAAAAEAGEGHLTFLGNAKYTPALRTSLATAALVPLDFTEEIPAIRIKVENPSVAFAQIVAQFAPPPLTFPPGVHPSAIVAPDVALGADVSIGANAVIEKGATIGDRTVIGAGAFIGVETRIGADSFIHPNATIRERCVIGNRVTIHSGTVVGSDGFGYEQVNGKHVKIPQVGIVQIDDDVEIGSNVAIDRARFGRTWIGEGTKIDNLVQIAHNVVIGKHAIIISHVGISGSTRVGNYAIIAGQAGLVGHITIGDQAIIGAQAGVSKDVPAKAAVLGSPAVPMREFKENLVYYNNLKKLNDRVKALEKAAGLRA